MDLRDIKEFFRDCFGYIVTFVIIAFILTFVVAFHPVAGNSMVPTLEEGNVALVSKSHQFIFGVKKNQIVIVKKEGKTYIKRVVGLPGEEVHYLNNVLYVNDTPYKENFLGSGVTTNNFMFEDICSKEDCPDGKIPDGYYLVLGDNRNESIDSRDNNFGLVKKNEIKGVVIVNIWPLDSINIL